MYSIRHTKIQSYITLAINMHSAKCWLVTPSTVQLYEVSLEELAIIDKIVHGPCCTRTGLLTLMHSQDEQLFDAIMTNQNHVLHQLLTPLSDVSQRYILRPRAHNGQLPDYSSHLCQSNFINRLLYKTLTENVFIALCCV